MSIEKKKKIQGKNYIILKKCENNYLNKHEYDHVCERHVEQTENMYGVNTNVNN